MSVWEDQIWGGLPDKILIVYESLPDLKTYFCPIMAGFRKFYQLYGTVVP